MVKESTFLNFLEKIDSGEKVFLSGDYNYIYKNGQLNKVFLPLARDFEIPCFLKEFKVEKIGLWISPSEVFSWLHYVY